MGRIPAVQHQRIAVWILEERHMTDARVDGLLLEPHALLEQRLARRLDVLHPERDLARIRCERKVDLLRLPDRERHLPGLHLEADGRVGLERQPEGLEVEPARALDVAGRERYVV